MEEVWKVIDGYIDYSVSSLGRVYSRKRGGTMLRPSVTSKRYHQVDLHEGGKHRMYKVHRLVMEAFVSKRPDGMECNHKDTIKSNNRLDNLEWITPGNNQKHAYLSGLRIPLRGERNGQAKLGRGDVVEIKKLYGSKGYTLDGLGKMFNVHKSTIHLIVNNKRWVHLGGKP